MKFSAHHTAISAVDLEESISFYEKFGFRVALRWKDPEGKSEIVHLKLGGYFLEIFWYRDQVSAPDTASELSTDLPRIGVKHFALQVESVEDARDFVRQAGIASDVDVREGKTGVVYFFIKDPSGILVEVLEDKRGL
ncbi:VOC family protein [Micromonospora sp. WMMC241]|uniref:VOC family protein n=1 Tax=Micromonospora sp. WMMC241 TaxID=3015159 RepID=UPI0022B6F80C|nr:VOC family protein [Micromonospora sp. WMMC241]MCZ7439434.1 VOC family protein [Micromonospora sp. WMMC241]